MRLPVRLGKVLPPGKKWPATVAGVRRVFGRVIPRSVSVKSLSDESLVVLWSVRQPGFDANPFITSLADSIGRPAEIRYFSWRRALLERYQLLHLHWPEDLFRAKRHVSRVPKYALFLLLFLRLKVTRTPVIWTVHNNHPHEGVGAVERILLRLCMSLITQRVFMSAAQRDMVDARERDLVIRHGHYKDSYIRAASVHQESAYKTILYFGFVRRYKGVETLIEAFDQVQASRPVRLVIAGRPNPQQYGAELHERYSKIANVNWLLEFQTKESTSELFAAADLVVLPYKKMVNSGALLLGLSMGKRVLAPRNRVTLEIQNEVGESWLHLYDGDLDSDDLARSLLPPTGDIQEQGPNLALRDWDRIGKEYRAAYLDATTPSRGQ